MDMDITNMMVVLMACNRSRMDLVMWRSLQNSSKYLVEIMASRLDSAD